jgi:hypothetical protein
MRCLVALSLLVPLFACSGGADPAGGADAAGADAAGSGGLTSDCPWLSGDGVDADPGVTTCAISDWEHDFTCERVAPEQIWVCCGWSPTAGVLCQYGACPDDLGAPCCDGLQGNPHGYACVDGRWRIPAP